MVSGHSQKGRGPAQYLRQRLRRIKIQAEDRAEAVAQRRGQEPGTRGRADQREALEIQLDGAGGWSLADHQIDLIILHRRVEDFLYDVIQPVNLVDEQDVALLEIRQQRRQVARPLHHRTGRGLDVDSHLARDDVSERGLAQARRPVEQEMVQDILPSPSGGDRHFEILLDLVLTHVLFEGPGPEIDLVF